MMTCPVGCDSTIGSVLLLWLELIDPSSLPLRNLVTLT